MNVTQPALFEVQRVNIVQPPQSDGEGIQYIAPMMKHSSEKQNKECESLPCEQRESSFIEGIGLQPLEQQVEREEMALLTPLANQRQNKSSFCWESLHGGLNAESVYQAIDADAQNEIPAMGILPAAIIGATNLDGKESPLSPMSRPASGSSPHPPWLPLGANEAPNLYPVVEL